MPPVTEAGSEAEAPRTSEAEVVEASAAGPVARDTEMEVGQPLVPPLAQGLPPSQESAREVEVQATSSDDTSRGKEAQMSRRPAPPSSQFRLLARETRPSCGYDPSPMGGITRVYRG